MAFAALMAFAAKPGNAFLLAELCERVYPDRNRIEKKHRNAVTRAAKTILDMAWGRYNVVASIRHIIQPDLLRNARPAIHGEIRRRWRTVVPDQ